VGIDTEPWDALVRFTARDLEGFARRWLTAAERAWCRGQPDPARGMVAIVCGKEAVWKATGGRVGLEAIEVAGREGLRDRMLAGGLGVELSWRFGAANVLVTAIASAV
jgi:phosphopantetheinyl transferase (holo-ACP synthase)